MIYDRSKDLDSKHHQQQRISKNVALNQHHMQNFPIQKYSLDLLITQ